MISYDGAGRVTRSVDPNGVVTDLTYSPRGWLLTRTVRANADGSASAGDAVTTIGYTPYGAVLDPDADGIVMSYTYDAAHRLTDITMRWAIASITRWMRPATRRGADVIPWQGAAHVSHHYNTLGELTQVIDGLSQAVFSAAYGDSYDANGNLAHSVDARGVQLNKGYDGSTA